MDKIKKCTVCNIKLDKENFKKDRTRGKNCYKKKIKNYNTTSEKESVIGQHIKIEHFWLDHFFRVKHIFY